jgi:hypothetical protein
LIAAFEKATLILGMVPALLGTSVFCPSATAEGRSATIRAAATIVTLDFLRA